MKYSCFYIQLTECFFDISFNKKWQYKEDNEFICLNCYNFETLLFSVVVMFEADFEAILHRINIMKMYLN